MSEIDFGNSKTITDAYEALGGIWPSVERDEYHSLLLYCIKSNGCGCNVGNFYVGGPRFFDNFFVEVCTREQFEAYVKEQGYKQEEIL